MSDTVTITFVGKDGVTPLLAKMEGSAKKTATSLESMGRKGAAAGKEVERGVKGADSALRTFERNSLAVGAAMGTMAMYVVRVSAAYQNQQRQLDAIGRLYGENAQRATEYAEAIQNTTRFSNDAARDSLVLLNTLTQNYDLNQNQIESLLSRSTDLAQMHGRTLTEITQMVSNALRGEGEYIEQIGVSMNQTFVAAEAAARGMKNFISEMSAAEQAAFRYTLLMEQTASSTGAAFAAMEGSRGVTATMINGLQDMGQAVGGALGPVRNLAAEFNNYALWLPLIGSQVGRMSALFVNMGRSGSIGANAMRAMTIATNPVTLGLTALTAVLGVVGYKMIESKVKSDQLKATNEQLAQSYQSLNEAIGQAYISGDKGAADFVKSQSVWLDTWVADWNTAVNATAENMQSSDNFDWMPDFIENLSRGLVIAGEEIGALFGADTPMADAMREGTQEAFLAAFEIPPEEVTAINNEMQRILQLAMTPGIDQQKFQADWNTFLIDLYGDLATGDIMPTEINEAMAEWRSQYAIEAAATISVLEQTKDEFKRALELDDLSMEGWSDSALRQLEVFDMLQSQISNFRSRVQQANAAAAVLSTGTGSVLDISYLKFTTEQTELLGIAWEHLGGVIDSGDWNNAGINNFIEDLNRGFMAGTVTAEQYTDTMIWLADGGYRVVSQEASLAMLAMSRNNKTAGEGVDVYSRLAEAMSEAGRFAAGGANAAVAAMMSDPALLAGQLDGGAYVGEIEAAIAANKEFLASYMALTGLDDPLAQINMTSLSNEYSELAQNIIQTGQATEIVFRAIVGNTNAIKSQADSILDWADALIGAEGTAARIDELLAGGFIDSGQFQQAQVAYNDIADAQERIGNNIDAIQAKQAPFIASMLEGQAVYIEQLNQLDDVQQRVALGFMDSATTSTFFQSIEMGTDLASMNIADMDQALQMFYQGVIQTNPLLFDMLETAGILSGTPLDFEVNTEALEGAGSELSQLVDGVGQLVDLLAQIFGIDLEVNGEEEVESAKRSIGELIADAAKDIVVNVKTSIIQGGGPGGDGTGGAGWGNALPPIEQKVTLVYEQNSAWDETSSSAWQPIEVPATPVFGDEPMAGVPTEPIEIPVTPIIEEAELPTMEPLTIQFVADSTDVSAEAAVWSSATISGPTFAFVADSSEVSAAAGVWAGSTISGPTMAFVADVSAVTAAAQAFAGATVATAYINIQPRMMGSIPGRRHGGGVDVDSFATGGQVVYRAAEDNNPEMAREPNGRSYMLHQEGLYAGPRGTIISPSNAHRGAGSGLRDVVLNVYGNIYGDDDLVDRVSDRVVPVLIEVVEDTRDAQPRIR